MKFTYLENNSPKKINGFRNSNSFGSESSLDDTDDDVRFNNKNVLPIVRVKHSLVEQLKKYDTCILLGETGCGKTTQVPQFILNYDLNNDRQVIVSQPRRIAAVSIAHRVAEERKDECGKVVGFKVRFQSEISYRTKLIYATDGCLLREALNDSLLSNYSVVILDEAHERSLTTDILFGVVKNAQNLRKIAGQTLKVIIMSAALDVDHFKEYFDDAPVFHIEGRRYKVDIFHTTEDVDDYYFNCLVTVFNIHTTKPPKGDILVFLTGQEEIEKMTRDIRNIARSPECNGPPIKVFGLYSSADPNTQLEVFRPAALGTRKVIVSTNIAETSITLPDIKYVIDSGRVKMRFHNSITGVSVLKVVMVSQEQALQRAGRAGRECDGHCYRTYSSKQYENFNRCTIPEIKRTNLASTVLSLLAMKQDPTTFDFIDKPDDKEIIESFRELRELGAIDKEDRLKLTEQGEVMSSIPLDPVYSKILLKSTEHGCGNEILDIISMLSTENIFLTPPDSVYERMLEVRGKFKSSLGDHITLLNVYRQFNRSKNKKDWCRENYINYRALDFACSIREQLHQLCIKYKIITVSCGQDEIRVQKCLITGFFNNIAILQADKSYSTVFSKQRCFIHPSSVLHKTLPHCVLYTELTKSNELYMKNVTTVDIDWLHEYVPESLRNKVSSLLQNGKC